MSLVRKNADGFMTKMSAGVPNEIAAGAETTSRLHAGGLSYRSAHRGRALRGAIRSVAGTGGDGSVVFDAVLVPGGQGVDQLAAHVYALHFIQEAFRHGKTIGAFGEGLALVRRAQLPSLELAKGDSAVTSDKGVVTSAEGDVARFVAAFVAAVACYRHWERDRKESVPA